MKLNKYVFVSLLFLSFKAFSMESGGKTCAEFAMPVLDLRLVEKDIKDYIGNNNIANKALEDMHDAIDAKKSKEDLEKLLNDLENVCNQNGQDFSKLGALAINHIKINYILSQQTNS